MNIAPEVLDVLKRSTISEEGVALPPGQLDRKLYVAVDKVLKAAGGKWNRGKRMHLFESDPREALGLAVESGEIRDEKKELQAFYTPDWLADRIAEHADVGPAESVLEPSCGDGALVRALERTGVLPEQITTVDVNPDARVRGDESRISHRVGDFMDELGLPCFDAVVMNPPFTKHQAERHVLRALKFAHRVVVAIMPPTWQTSNLEPARKLREELDDSFDWEVLPNPPRAFRESGTEVCTVTLVAHRR